MNCRHCRRAINPPRKFCDSACYGKWQRGRNFADQGKPTRERRSCSVDGCATVHFARGHCRKHYIALLYRPTTATRKRVPRKPLTCQQCAGTFFAYHADPKFCSRVCCTAFRTKPFILKKGYRKILRPDHPRADAKGYVFEHIVIAEAELGRPLTQGEEIHHKDFNRQNNAPDNLVVCASHAEHMSYHATPSWPSEK